jgi:hypothetical protein
MQNEIIDLRTGEFLERKDILNELRLCNKEFMRDIEKRLESDICSVTIKELREYRAMLGLRVNPRVTYDSYHIMTAQTISLDIIKSLNPNTLQVIALIGFFMNKDGIIRDSKNMRPLRSLGAVAEHLEITKHRWDSAIPDIRKYNIIKKVVIDKKSYLVVNPLFIVNATNAISSFRFIAFKEEYQKYLSRIDYLTLCVEFEIMP